MSTEVKELLDLVRKGDERVATLTKTVDSLATKMKNMRAPGHDPDRVFGTPSIRTGEDSMSSRGFSFMKMIGLLTGGVQPEEAKIELDVHNRMHNCFVKEMGSERYDYKGVGRDGVNRFLAPLATSFMPEKIVSNEFRRELKQLVAAGSDGADHDEMRWIRQRQLKSLGYGQKALSWLDEFSGGALVAPPEFGELIELLRNKEALIAAGARTVPLPPQGRIKYPKQTSASLTYWIGENKPITESEIGTGEISLQAKKLAVLIKSPNELLRFASPAAEALIRDDMTKSLALALDLAGLEALGGDTRPLGILPRTGITRITSGSPAANGDKLVGQDVYRMIAAVEEANVENFSAFIMRPKTKWKYHALRVDAVSQGDSAGMFLFDLTRSAGDKFDARLAGIPVVGSTQVSQVRSKGSASNLTYVLGGDFSECLIGMFGALEFAATTQGDTSFVNDQTWIRGILSADIAIRHEAAFVLLDNIDVTA